MTIMMEIGEAEGQLAELLTKVEAGEDVILSRGTDPVVRLSRIHRPQNIESTIAAIRAVRRSLPKTTIDEISEWKNEDRR